MDIKEKLETMSPFYMWLVFVLLYVSFSTEVLWRPFLFAEDTIFLNNALTDGFKSLFYRHAEYWEMISRLTANIAIFLGRGANSYLVTAFVMKAMAIAIFSYYILYFAIADFSWLVKEKWKRFLISFIVLIWFGNFFNSFYNITNIHWAGEYFLFLVGLNLVFNKKFPGIFCTVICLLTCMNSPEACLVLIPFAIYVLNGMIRRDIRLNEAAVYLLVFAAAGLQFYVIKISGNGSKVTDAGVIFSALPKSIVSILSSACYILGNETMSYMSPALRVMAGSLILGFIVFSYIKFCRMKGMFILLYVLAFLFMHYMTVNVKPLNANWVNQDYWIYSCPAAVLAFAFFCAAANMKQVFGSAAVRHVLVLFLAVIVVAEISHAGKIDGLGHHYRTYDYDMLGMGRIDDANKAVDFNGSNFKTVSLYAGWGLLLPVR